MSDGSDTARGYKHPMRRSSRPPSDVGDLPEPLIEGDPLKAYVVELHRDLRELRGEMLNRQDAERQAIYDVQSKVDRLHAAVEGVRICQDHAFKLLRDDKAKDRRAIAFIVFVILVVLLLRIYGLIGV